MADAWDTLYSNSPLGDGHDAWEHLLAQQGGEAVDCEWLITADSNYSVVEVDIETVLSSSVDDVLLEVDLDEALSADADDEILTTEVCS